MQAHTPHTTYHTRQIGKTSNCCQYVRKSARVHTQSRSRTRQPVVLLSLHGKSIFPVCKSFILHLDAPEGFVLLPSLLQFFPSGDQPRGTGLVSFLSLQGSSVACLEFAR